MKKENNGILLQQKDMIVEEVITKEALKGDTRKVTLKYGDDVKVTIEGPVEGLENFKKNQVVDVGFSKRQQELT